MRPASCTCGLVAATMIVASGLTGCSQGDQVASDERQAEVAERGAEVMGFDLEATVHQCSCFPLHRGQQKSSSEPVCQNPVKVKSRVQIPADPPHETPARGVSCWSGGCATSCPGASRAVDDIQRRG